ncbi:MAG TPA: penicillin acylase family protein, partial [Polyangiaceae bacterium]|nr:penicillin acylase family protein [Polyangiaceae bacterium]
MLTAAKRRAGGRARRGAAAACGLAAGALLAGRCYVRTAATAHGDFALPGLRAAAEVDWDAHDVPSVRAGSRADAYRALGFLHARDRLWQMDRLRRAGRGRMSEVYGADLVETDRFLRTLGVARAAERDEALLDPDDRALLAAYAEGVNAWLAARPGALPPEFLALRYEPEPWAVGDSLAVAKLMAWNQA